MKNRFETVMASNHLRWQYCHFTSENFDEASKQAHATMTGAEGGKLVGPFLCDAPQTSSDAQGETFEADAEESRNKVPEDPAVVYLTSDSPHTLEQLEPYTSYVVGGIVDKNREKGLCYKRAKESGIRTAKLPIGEFMVMASRQVLTTNQVVEIMSKWLDCRDWGEAFTAVIPKRKGGVLVASKNEVNEDDTHKDPKGDGENDDQEEMRKEAELADDSQSDLPATAQAA